MEGNRITSTATRWWVTGDSNAPVLQPDVRQAARLVLRGKGYRPNYDSHHACVRLEEAFQPGEVQRNDCVLSKSNALFQEPCFTGEILQMLSYKACVESLLSCGNASCSYVFKPPFSGWQARTVLGGCAIARL